MTDYGIKVTLAGYDVATATDRQIIFSSEFDTIKIASSGSGNVDPNGSATTVEIVHGLGYVPAYTVYFEISKIPGADNDFYLAPFTLPVGGDLSQIAYADSTKLYIRFGADAQGPSAGDSYDYKYVIFINDGSD